MNEEFLEMNKEALKEISAIKEDPLLNIQILCLLQLVSKGIYLSVELITKNSSKIF